MAFDKHGIVGRDPSPMVITGPAFASSSVASGADEPAEQSAQAGQRRRA
jgi:hypothetical protein